MKDEKYIELLFKRADKSITKMEQSDLMQWLSLSKANAEKARRVEEIWRRSGALGDERDLDLDLDFEFGKLKHRIDRHQPTAKVRKLWRPWQIAASLAILLIATWLITRSGSTMKTDLVYEGRYQVLADNSQVWLAEGDKGTFRERSDHRLFTLDGKGYFEVAKDQSRPFEVATPVGLILVLGTAFEVDATQSNQTIVTVWEGRVKVTNLTQTESMTLIAGEGALLRSNKIDKYSTGEETVAAWRRDPISFAKQPLAKVIGKIEESYPITIDVEHVAMMTCEVTFTLTYPTLDVLITTLETLLGASITKQGSKQYLINGDGCQ